MKNLVNKLIIVGGLALLSFQSLGSSYSERVYERCGHYNMLVQTIGGQSPITGEVKTIRKTVLRAFNDSEEVELSLLDQTSDSATYVGQSDILGKVILRQVWNDATLEFTDVPGSPQVKCL